MLLPKVLFLVKADRHEDTKFMSSGVLDAEGQELDGTICRDLVLTFLKAGKVGLR
jgi:hypothetical protein